jgi:hypothetical protein
LPEIWYPTSAALGAVPETLIADRGAQDLPALLVLLAGAGAVLALAVLAAAGLLLAGRRRLAVAGAIGALALIEGLGRLGVFVHGVVISELPAAAARAADSVAIGAGLAAVVIALTQPSRTPVPARRRTRRNR